MGRPVGSLSHFLPEHATASSGDVRNLSLGGRLVSLHAKDICRVLEVLPS